MSEADEAIERELMRLVRSLERVHRSLQGADDVSHRLERSAYRVLAHIVDAGPVRLSGLAGLACVDVSTVSRQVTDLEAHGLVVREVDPTDGRAALLRATDRGDKLLRLTRESRGRFVREVLASWPAVDRHELGRLLARFNDGISATALVRQESS